MNILITGGAGFIGSNLVRRMVKKYPDFRVVNLDRLTYAGNLENLRDVEGRPNYTFVKGDIKDKALVKNAFERYGIDSVMHLAAESHVDRSILSADEFLNTNVLGTHALLEAARSFWKDRPAGPAGRPAKARSVFLNVSTDEVYGSLPEAGSFTESSPCAPNSPYSASKASADHLCRAYNKTYGVPVITTHSSNNYGPYQLPEKLIPLMVLNAMEGKPLPVYGDGLNVRDWLHVEDHCSALEAALLKGSVGETYNIGADNEWKNIDLIKLICKILDELRPGSPNVPHASLIRFVKDRPGHDLRYSIDSSRMRRELGWAPSMGFEEGLKSTVEWYAGNLAWCERARSGEYMEYYEKNYMRR
ncbi:MAG: dTDP-glucose 4,6-dehydratase [Deltaproteobacteria bacterium]|nr:dTDP-glucose 4,6-dehydratase [Deltaproteobacteria bacterium]